MEEMIAVNPSLTAEDDEILDYRIKLIMPKLESYVSQGLLSKDIFDQLEKKAKRRIGSAINVGGVGGTRQIFFHGNVCVYYYSIGLMLAAKVINNLTKYFSNDNVSFVAEEADPDQTETVNSLYIKYTVFRSNKSIGELNINFDTFKMTTAAGDDCTKRHSDKLTLDFLDNRHFEEYFSFTKLSSFHVFFNSSVKRYSWSDKTLDSAIEELKKELNISSNSK